MPCSVARVDALFRTVATQNTALGIVVIPAAENLAAAFEVGWLTFHAVARSKI